MAAPANTSRAAKADQNAAAGIPAWLLAVCPPFLQAHIEKALSSPLAVRLLHGAFWSTAGAVIGRGIGLVTWMIVARLLGRQIFGELGFLLSTFSLLEKLSLFGIGMMATRYVAQHRATDKGRAGRVMGLSVILSGAVGALMAAALFLPAPWIAEHLFGAPHLGDMLRIGCLLVLIYAFTGVAEGCLAGLEAFKAIAAINLVNGVLCLPLITYGAWAAGLAGALWMMVLGAGFQALLSYAILRRVAATHGCGITFHGIWAESRVLLEFSIPILLSTQTLFFGEWLGSWLLVRGPGGFGQMGIYNAASRWQQAVSFVPLYVGRALFPALAERHGADDRQSFIRLLKVYLILSTTIALGCALVLSLLSKLIMSGYGAEFTEGWPVLVIVAMTVVLLPLRWTIEMTYRSLNAVWWEVLMNLMWTAVLMAGMATLHMRGAWKLAVATMLAFLLTNLMGAIHVYFKYFRGHLGRHGPVQKQSGVA